MFIEEDFMRLMFQRALVVIATFVLLVAFSPGLALAFALVALALDTGHTPATWLKAGLNFFAPKLDDVYHGHGHLNSQATGHGAGGRHGSPRTIAVLVMLAIWAVLSATWSRIGHEVSKLATSAGHGLAKMNASAQPLPS